ncbi:MAG TPA: nitrate- and nitrite sensing domain-containing protein [Candidatus Limnocylindria bacterium]|nr:nitrate- and nitrite sensing domain-containing protein [Candidatus Limnocylindria bacterium]
MPAAVLGPLAARLIAHAGELMHAIQSERSASVLHVISPGRRRAVLERTWAETDVAARKVLLLIRRNHAVLPEGALEPFTEMRGMLEARPCLQVTVRERRVPAPEVVARYSAIIGRLLTGIDECAELASEPELARLYDAHRALMRAEEEASLARAYGMLVLAGLTPGDTPALSRLLAQQQLHLAEFAAGALPHVRSVLAERATRPAFQRAEQLERLAAATGLHHDLLTSEEWYATLTAKLRALREVDDLDATALLDRAGEAAAAPPR